MMPLGKVTDLTFERSLGGRMLGYGTLIVESAGQIQALNRIDYMPRPEEIYEALSELVFGEKGKTRATGMLARPRWRALTGAAAAPRASLVVARPRIDLHTHSTVSDGTDSPSELVAAAHAAGVDVLAITDHDTTGGWDEAAAALRPGMSLVGARSSRASARPAAATGPCRCTCWVTCSIRGTRRSSRSSRGCGRSGTPGSSGSPRRWRPTAIPSTPRR